VAVVLNRLVVKDVTVDCKNILFKIEIYGSSRKFGSKRREVCFF
jgi:hypothetical protein